MTAGLRWADAIDTDARILLIVNSSPGAIGEVHGVLDAAQTAIASRRVSVIAPRSMCRDFVRAGVPSRSVLPCDLDIGYFLQGSRALQWALRQRPDLIVASEPYAPNNTEVKVEFERHLTPLLGHADLLTHSLPTEQVFRFSLEDVWRRAARPEAVAALRTQVEGTLDELNRVWSELGSIAPKGMALAVLKRMVAAPQPSIERTDTVVEAAGWACHRLQDALLSDGGYPPSSVRVLTDPPGVTPPAGFAAGVAQIGRPAHIAQGLRVHRDRAVFRGQVEEQFSALLMSRYVDLATGDAVAAEGRLYAGGITIGLVEGGNWASRVDLVDPGPFLAAAVAPHQGKFAVVVANCRPGLDRKAAFALRRLGFQRLEK